MISLFIWYLTGAALVAMMAYALPEHVLKKLFTGRAIWGWIALLVIGPLVHAWLWHFVWDTPANRVRVAREIKDIVQLSQANPDDPSYARDLIERTQSSYHWEASYAVWAIGEIGDAAIPIIDELAELMFSEDRLLAREASLALVELGPRSVLVISQLERRVATGITSDSAWFAAEAIGNLGADATRSLPVLRDRLGASPVLDEYLLRAIEAIEAASDESTKLQESAGEILGVPSSLVFQR
jgi:hypothetical protein